MTEETGGTFGVSLSQQHLEELIMVGSKIFFSQPIWDQIAEPGLQAGENGRFFQESRSDFGKGAGREHFGGVLIIMESPKLRVFNLINPQIPRF